MEPTYYEDELDNDLDQSPFEFSEWYDFEDWDFDTDPDWI
jgi:hypothetical protein